MQPLSLQNMRILTTDKGKRRLSKPFKSIDKTALLKS